MILREVRLWAPIVAFFGVVIGANAYRPARACLAPEGPCADAFQPGGACPDERQEMWIDDADRVLCRCRDAGDR